MKSLYFNLILDLASVILRSKAGCSWNLGTHLQQTYLRGVKNIKARIMRIKSKKAKASPTEATVISCLNESM
jgi:hypothetical protein